MLWPKINSYKEFDNDKKFPRLENSPPPHNFSNGRSLIGTDLRWLLRRLGLLGKKRTPGSTWIEKETFYNEIRK